MVVLVVEAKMGKLVGGEEMAETQPGTATERTEKMVQEEESKWDAPELCCDA
jgi:hypothetical protein